MLTTNIWEVWEYFRIQNLGSYHNFYMQNDTLLLEDVLEDVFESYWRMHLKASAAKA